ncbi:MAG: hypothetical protein HKN90_02595, partial [Flavobacteriaceae bacterium]|nr:hypothetical protein [Flavobacteriaceae bacterium]
MIRTILLTLLVATSLNSLSQIKDIGGIDYTTLVGDGGDADFSRTRVWINFPIKLNKENHLLVSGFRYSNIDLDFNRTFDFDVNPLKTIHSIEYTLGYTFLLKNKDWRFTAQLAPTISSNLEAKIKFDDLLW